jgi:SAM-dependent methyltransferase
MPEDHFGAAVAPHYDAHHAGMFTPEAIQPAVDRLAELADGGTALELAIGTGRIALPLAARGISVKGIELSAAMVDQLRAKRGGSELPVTLGDMATTTVAGTFDLVYLVFNTIVNLTSQDAQVRCFQNAANHLEPGGSFVVEVNVPQLRRLPPGERGYVFALEEGYWGISEVDVVDQQMISHHLTATDSGLRHRRIPFRYVWPSELDLMARLAGLHLRDRWDGWSRSPFTAESKSHVSVWEKPQVQ